MSMLSSMRVVRERVMQSKSKTDDELKYFNRRLDDMDRVIMLKKLNEEIDRNELEWSQCRNSSTRDPDAEDFFYNNNRRILNEILLLEFELGIETAHGPLYGYYRKNRPSSA